MALKETIKHMKELLNNITLDLEKAEAGNKAASQRVRTGTVRLEKIAKSYRKESIKGEKTPTRTKKPAAKKQPAKATAAKAKPAASAKAKAKPKASVAKARGRSLAIKRPTAKLPSHRSFR